MVTAAPPPPTRLPEETLLLMAGCSSHVISHCRAVRDLAVAYADRSGVAESKRVAAGAMLHDIGRGRTHSLRHGQEGADTCREIGVPEEIARIVECHTGAGLTADECTLLGLLPRDCMPDSPEACIVAHVDNLLRGVRLITIEERLMRSFFLPRRIRQRVYRLACTVDLLCKDLGSHRGARAGSEER